MYHRDNIDGTQNLINVCKFHNVTKVIVHQHHLFIVVQKHLNIGRRDSSGFLHQKNLYAYTKYVNECQFKMSGLHNIGLRFLQYMVYRTDKIWHCMI